MAHIDHFKRKDVFKIAKEVAREIKSKKYENEVDLSRSHLNYSLMGETTASGITNFVNNKIKEVVPDATKQMLGNMKPLCVACVYLPVELEDRSEEDKRRFFETTLEFFKDRYGDGDNIAYATVHRDETREHIHIGFVPVGVSRKTGKRTVSAASVVTQADLESLHPDYDAVIAKEFGMAGLVMNGRTEGKYTLKEYKARKDDKRKMEQEKAELKELKLEVQDKAMSLRAKTMEADAKLSDADKELEEADAKLERVKQMEQRLQQEQTLLRIRQKQVEKEREEVEERQTLLERLQSSISDLISSANEFKEKVKDAFRWAENRKSEHDMQRVLDKQQEYTEKVDEPTAKLFKEYNDEQIDASTLLEGLEQPIIDANDLISDLKVYQPSALER